MKLNKEEYQRLYTDDITVADYKEIIEKIDEVLVRDDVYKR